MSFSEWHFEHRQSLNTNLPDNPDEATPDDGWEELPPEMSQYHDNGVGKPERKFINVDGREAVYDGDSGELVTDPEFMGTYNYVNPAKPPKNKLNLYGWGRFVCRGLGHFAFDMVPYYIGGNVRGEG